MKPIKTIVALAFVCLTATANSQSLWSSADFKYDITKRLSANAAVEYRTSDKLRDSERITAGFGLDYKVIKYLKFDLGYKFMTQRTPLEITKKGNLIPAFWSDRHRAYVSTVGKINVSRFSISLRERYQFTHRDGKWIPKYASDGEKRKDDEWISSKEKHILRSRIECSYNIKKSRFTPSISIETYNNFDGFGIEKTRYTAGCAYKINKHNSVGLFYRYISVKGGGDDEGSVIGVGYSFKL